MNRIYNYNHIPSYIVVLFSMLIIFHAEFLQAETPSSTPPPEPPPIASDYGKSFFNFQKMKLTANIDAFLSLSDLNGSDELWGGNFDAIIAPRYEINDQTMFILMYDGIYYKKRDFYSDDIGSRERAEYMGHNFTPMLRMDFGEKSRHSITPLMFYSTTYNKDVATSRWSKGLYNYRDWGAGVDYEMRELGYGDGKGTMKLGTQVYTREYPNFDSLLDKVSQDQDGNQFGDTEKDVKDYSGIIATAGYDWIKKSGYSWSAGYSVLYKELKDKKVINELGNPGSSKQRDHIHTLNLGFSYAFSKEFNTGVNTNCILNRSNQDYFDIIDFTSGNWVHTRHFYDFNSYLISPNMAYTFRLFPITTQLSYSFMKTNYTDRKSKNSAGEYLSKKQWDTQNSIDILMKYSLTKNWQFACSFGYTSTNSNNRDEAVYQYDYKVRNYMAGVSYNY